MIEMITIQDITEAMRDFILKCKGYCINCNQCKRLHSCNIIVNAINQAERAGEYH